MATCPLTATELDDVLAILHRLGPDAPQWRTEPTPAGERGVILCGPAGMRVLIETAWSTPERLLISGLLPASPAGDFYPPLAQITPAITVARTRGPRALATAIPAPAPADVSAAPPGGPGAGARISRRCGTAGGGHHPAGPGAWLYCAADARAGGHRRHQPGGISRLGAGHGDTGGRCHPDRPWPLPTDSLYAS